MLSFIMMIKLTYNLLRQKSRDQSSSDELLDVLIPSMPMTKSGEFLSNDEINVHNMKI